MDSYSEFARVYDLFMDNVDYRGWGDWLVSQLKDRGIEDGIVCELGCGTGSMTEYLADAGYDMIGIDASPEMLEIAYEKKQESGHDILYLLQDMREFELYGTVRAVVSVCDSLNYLTDPRDLLEVFRLVNNYLDPGGYFLFDMNTPARYRAIGDATIAENREAGSFIWENQYDPDEQINEYLLTLFLPASESGLYRKVEELHTQRAYTVGEVSALLEEAGLEFVCALEAYANPAGTADEKTERVVFVAREHGK